MLLNKNDKFACWKYEGLLDHFENQHAITIGNFDGFHLGHQALVRSLVQSCQKLKTTSCLITFQPHPVQVLKPNVVFPAIYNPLQKTQYFNDFPGLNAACFIRFTQALAQLEPEFFFTEYLCKYISVSKVIVGHDFSFGRNKEGGLELLERICRKNNIIFEYFPPIKIREQVVSSTLIRKLLLGGRFRETREFLGREWSIQGNTVKGKQLGRKLGFPTFNLLPKIYLPIPYGVYASEILINGKKFKSITNFGVKPTFEKEQATLETHVFGYNSDSEEYGSHIEVFPKFFIRPEKKFSSVDELSFQIKKDIDKACS